MIPTTSAILTNTPTTASPAATPLDEGLVALGVELVVNGEGEGDGDGGNSDDVMMVTVVVGGCSNGGVEVVVGGGANGVDDGGTDGGGGGGVVEGGRGADVFVGGGGDGVGDGKADGVAVEGRSISVVDDGRGSSDVRPLPVPSSVSGVEVTVPVVSVVGKGVDELVRSGVLIMSIIMIGDVSS